MEAPDPKRRQRNDLGPIGELVRANIKRLREDKRRRLSTTKLSNMLGEVGRPIAPTGITKIETGDRRVDVGDLVALAVALDVTPNELLLTPDASAQPVDLTPTVSVTRERAWQWATGELPLRDLPRTYRVEGDRRYLVLGDLAKIDARRPHDPIDPMTFDQVFKHMKALIDVKRAVKVLEDAGLNRRQVFNGLGLLDTLAEARDRLEDLDEE